ncbi:DJ-1/PfpI family protein [Deinococcus roseus]|uniref:DJ-1/PfpI domain-containing protein n=1 Tax=Deinococcus roseus TaxID=392414 RepID=A0ABQ2CYQ8_9DEIO|nr:DJ-1/PfpI family protein [Deinococcus roseus]GGJ26967.1 hypothetical protein GCM10008938_11350 [Deinococcus roseus]
MKTPVRVSLCVLTAVLLPFAVGQYQSMKAHETVLLSSAPQRNIAGMIAGIAAPVLDPSKPTVVVVLGSDVSEVADVLVPYQVFAASGKFNVVTAAAKRLPVALTGGLDLLPHYTFQELDQKLSAGPRVVIVPNIPFIQNQGNAAVLSWLQVQGKHPKTIIMGICSGANTLALAGLLNGKKATAHWSDLGTLNKNFPEVQWVRDQRYVDEGLRVTSAGVLSGLDSSLHVLERLSGEKVLLETMQKINYAPSPYLQNPHMKPIRAQFSDGIFLLNASYLWDRPTYPLPLQNRMDEMDLAALVDTFPATFSAKIVTTAKQPIKTHYGLDVLPRTDHADPTLPVLKLTGTGFPFDQALKQLAAVQNVPTAVFGARRLEYRSGPESYTGAGWGNPVVYRPLFLAVLGVLLVLLLEWGFVCLRKSKTAPMEIQKNTPGRS